jgi:hypothetical protein
MMSKAKPASAPGIAMTQPAGGRAESLASLAKKKEIQKTKKFRELFSDKRFRNRRTIKSEEYRQRRLVVFDGKVALNSEMIWIAMCRSNPRLWLSLGLSLIAPNCVGR